MMRYQKCRSRDLILIKTLSEDNSLAVIWKYFLNVTIQYPKVYIPLIYPLLIAKPVMFLEDTNYTYANFLNKCYKELTSKQRAEIEGVILSNDFAHENEELTGGTLIAEKQ